MNNKLSTYKKHLFFYTLVVSCLETGMATISQINPKMYYVPRICVLKVQKDWSTRTSYCLQNTTTSMV